ncbi:flagellar hook-basal body protein [Patulibacter defluvii]|uniref:flagellar hook-basal body protein n=1 Tax=Patulibacter defluvii TaxID=3095358 RepID=UPI002A765E8E|nr:flagellar hook-basal body protein [Patulibacter sp. DM4]
MDRGLYVAAAGMIAGQVRQDQLAGDLANAATPGYKRDRTTQASFGDVLLSNTRSGQAVGPVGYGPYADAVTTDLRPQALRETGEPLDFAIAGEGFFAVRTPDGVRYTRNGQFQSSARGTLVDAFGHDVLGPGGAPVRVDGEGRADPRAIAVVALAGPRKAGEGLWTGRPAGAADGRVQQGALEGSGVDPARAMVEMIAALRAYEAGQKSITTIDETLGRAATQVGNAGGG